jgi:hypothetical protein
MAVAEIVAKSLAELGKLDEWVRKLANIDFIIKDGLEERSTRKALENLNYIFFSPRGVRPALEMLRDRKIRSANQRDEIHDMFIQSTQTFFNENQMAYKTINELNEFLSSSH